MQSTSFQSCLLGIAIALNVTSAAAWENDVHYGLTKWLSLQAGFTEEQAGWIASGNVGIDKSPVTEPVHTTFVSACIGGSDPTGSGQVHDHHFPSERSVPNDPNVRIVKPGSVQQGGNTQSAPRISDYRDRSRLRELGEYLHAFQDTWSHQGEPDIPPVCDPKLGWGHAFTRGGWSCHLADLTYFWQDVDVLPMARATYEALAEQTPGVAKAWETLEPKIKLFSSARSKWEKDIWFAQERFTDRTFLQEISLPDCISGGPCPGAYAAQKLIDNWKEISKHMKDWTPPRGFAPITFPVDVTQLVRDFAEALVFQSQGELAKRIDTELAKSALARALHINGACPDLYDKLAPIMLGSGFTQGWGARQPTELCELAFQVARSGKGNVPCDLAVRAAQSARPVEVGPDLQELRTKIMEAKEPLYFITTSFDKLNESYVAFVRFAHLPRDILMLTTRRVAGTPKITGIIWVPDQ